MKLLHNILDRSFYCWTIFGPLTVVAILLAALIKGSNTLFVPLVALIGIPLCWIWQTRGFFIASILLFAAFLNEFPSISPQDQMWHVGMCLSIIISFLITSMTQLEFAVAFPEQKQTVHAQHHDLLHRINLLEHESLQAREAHERSLSALGQEIEQLHLQLAVQTEELAKSEAHQKQQLSENQKLQHRIKELQHLLDIEKQAKIGAEASVNALLKVKAELEKKEVLISKAQQDFQDLKFEKSLLEQQITTLNEKLLQKPSEVDLSSYKELEHSFKTCQGQLNQLRCQFEEKTSILNETRKQLFHVEETLIGLRRTQEDREGQAELKMQQAIATVLKDCKKEMDESASEYEKEIAGLHQLIDSLVQQQAQEESA